MYVQVGKTMGEISFNWSIVLGVIVQKRVFFLGVVIYNLQGARHNLKRREVSMTIME